MTKVDIKLLCNPPKFLNLFDFFKYMIEMEVYGIFNGFDLSKCGERNCEGNVSEQVEYDLIYNISECICMRFISEVQRNVAIKPIDIMMFVDDLVESGMMCIQTVEQHIGGMRMYVNNPNFDESCVSLYMKYGTHRDEVVMISYILLNQITNNNVDSINSINGCNSINCDNYIDKQSLIRRNEFIKKWGHYSHVDSSVYDRKFVYTIRQLSMYCSVDINTICTLIESIPDNSIYIVYCIFFNLHLNDNIRWDDIKNISLMYTHSPRHDRIYDMLHSSPKITIDILYSDLYLVNQFFEYNHFIPNDRYLMDIPSRDDIMKEYETHGTKPSLFILSSPNITFDIAETLIRCSYTSHSIDDECGYIGRDVNGDECDVMFTMDYTNPYTYQMSIVRQYKEEVEMALPYVISIQRWWRDISSYNPRRRLARSKLMAIISEL